MSNVTLSIGGRDFRVGCRDGQEDDIRKLGELIDEKVRKANVHDRGPAEMLLFASLLLADDLKDAADTFMPKSPEARDMADDEALAAIAVRLETVASRLEQARTNP